MPEGIVIPGGRDRATGKQRGTRKGHVSLAVQTGSNDNTALADCIANLPTDGGVIELGKGTHYLDNFMLGSASQNAVTLKGVGADPNGITGTIIKPSSTTSGNPVIYATGSFKTPTIEDLTIDCTLSRTNPCFRLAGALGTSGYAASARRCVFLNGHASGMSATGGRNGALTEVDGSTDSGEIIVDFDDCRWIHGGPSTSNMFVRTTNLHLMFKNRKMSMGVGSAAMNIDCAAVGWITDIHPYTSANGASYVQDKDVSAFKTVSCGLTNGSRVITGTFVPEDTGHNVQGTGISGTGVWITEVTDATHAKISTAATSTTTSTLSFRRMFPQLSTLGGCDYNIRGTYNDINIFGGDGEAYVDLIRYNTDQYGGSINLYGIYTPSRFNMIGGRGTLNMNGGSVYSGFIYSQGGALYVNAEGVAVGSIRPASFGPGSVTLIGGITTPVEKPVMCSRKDGTVVFTGQHTWMQDFNKDASTSTFRAEKEALATKFWGQLSTLPSGYNNPLNYAVLTAGQEWSGASNDAVYFAGGLRNPVTGKLDYGTGMRRNASTGWREHTHSQDATNTPGSVLQIGDSFLGAVSIRDYLILATLFKPTAITGKATLVDADMLARFDSAAGGNPMVVQTWAEFKEQIQDMTATFIQNGTGITWTYNDVSNTLTANVSITQYTDEMAMDAIAAMIVNGTGISWSYNDGSNTLTATISLASFSTSNLSEGSNLYFTDERAQDAVGAALLDTNRIDLTYNDAGNQISANLRWTPVTSSSATVSPAASDSGKWYRLTNASPTFNLPASAGCVDGETHFMVVGTAGTLTVVPNAGDDFYLYYFDESDDNFAGGNVGGGVTAAFTRNNMIEIWYGGGGLWFYKGGPVIQA